MAIGQKKQALTPKTGACFSTCMCNEHVIGDVTTKRENANMSHER